MALHTSEIGSKSEYRRLLRESRRSLSQEARLQKSRLIWEACRVLPAFRDADLICSYVAFGEEVGTADLLRSLLGSRHRVAVPAHAATGGEPAFAEINLWSELAPNSLGYLEPLPARTRIVPTSSVGCFLVPGVGFDIQGNRLGYGLGYYDRALQSASPEAVFVGLAFDIQIVKKLPVTGHDVPMDYVVTETRVFDLLSRRDR